MRTHGLNPVSFYVEEKGAGTGPSTLSHQMIRSKRSLKKKKRRTAELDNNNYRMMKGGDREVSLRIGFSQPRVYQGAVRKGIVRRPTLISMIFFLETLSHALWVSF